MRVKSITFEDHRMLHLFYSAEAATEFKVWEIQINNQMVRFTGASYDEKVRIICGKIK